LGENLLKWLSQISGFLESLFPDRLKWLAVVIGVILSPFLFLGGIAFIGMSIANIFNYSESLPAAVIFSVLFGGAFVVSFFLFFWKALPWAMSQDFPNLREYSNSLRQAEQQEQRRAERVLSSVSSLNVIRSGLLLAHSDGHVTEMDEGIIPNDVEQVQPYIELTRQKIPRDDLLRFYIQRENEPPFYVQRLKTDLNWRPMQDKKSTQGKKATPHEDIMRYDAEPVSTLESPTPGTRWTLTVRFEKEEIARSSFSWIKSDAPRMVDFQFDDDYDDDEPAGLGNLLQGRQQGD
jgi:hypothetical protein